MARGRHVRSRRFGVVAVVATVASVAMLVAGGGAFAAYRYEHAREAVILPGVTIDGVDVGGLTKRQATLAIRDIVGRELEEPLTIEVAGRTMKVTPAELGRLADDVFRPWRNAGIGITDDANDIVFARAAPGRKLPVDEAAASIRAALDAGDRRVTLETLRLRPKVTNRSLGRTIVVRVDENRLYLYEGFEVLQTWDVATAKPGWITPTGVWTIWDKRVNPTWYNPALDSWGASLPAVVPGGPTAPMGTRAIYIDAPGLIRVHGTPAPSSIGRYASHGCIRMRNEEVEALFEMIPVGAKVVIVGHRPAGAQEGDTPARFDI